MPRGSTRAATHNRILEEPAMAKARSLVGLDVHATKIVAAVLDVETGQVQTFEMTGETEAAAGFCGALPRPVRAAYEAGPTGYGLARELVTRGVQCVVAAPSKIPRASGDRVKTDRRDAEHLVRLLWAGKLYPVRVPGPEEEALRDLVRARESVPMDLMRARHRLSKLLLRHGIRFDDGRAWTDRHAGGFQTVVLDWPAAQTTLLDCRGAIDALAVRRDQLEREIVALLPTCPGTVPLGRLRCLRGIDTLTAAGLCSEIGDFERFARAEQLMSYIGVVPSEATTGQQRRLGVDHQDRVRARPPAADRGGLALPAPAEPQQDAHRPPGRPAPGSGRGLLESPAAAAPHLDPAPSPRQTPDPDRRRRRPRTRRVLLGDHPDRITPRRHPPHSRRLGRWRPGKRAGNPRRDYEQPAHQAGHARL
jgi:transposase